MERSEIRAYLDFLKERGFRCAGGPSELVTDPEVLADFSARRGVKLGIVYAGACNTLVVDLLRNRDGSLYACERIVKTVGGNSVVVVPRTAGKLVLLRQFRPALGGEQECFPRGFGEAGLSPEENARKEIREELGCASSDYVLLGHTVADSGLCGEAVSVFRCEVGTPAVTPFYENILSWRAVDESELWRLIGAGAISDGFTLAAAALYRGAGD